MNCTRREFLKRAGLLGGLGLAYGAAGPRRARAAPPGAPNILFILADQMRRQAASCYGDPNLQTTNLDALAAGGLKFNNCVSNSPVCTPYRGMMMSGRFPSRTGLWDNHLLLDSNERCLAEAFVDEGYSTGYIGKWHIDGDEKPGPVHSRQGWQYWAGFNRGHYYAPGTGTYFTWAGGVYTQHSVPATQYEPDFQTDLAVNYIAERARTGSGPWFLMLAWGPPHTPYGEVAQQYKDLFDPAALTLRPNVPAANEANARSTLANYYAQIKSLDDYVGRLVQALADNGFANDTLVIFNSDHGDMHRSQGEQYKTLPWEESIGVPFLAKWPGGIVNPGRTVDALLQAVDLFPTLCGVAGLAQPVGKDGADYSHLFRDEAGPVADSAYLTIGAPTASNPWRGVRTPQYTYAMYPKSGLGYVLYDNFADPYQLDNLVDRPEHAALQEQLHQQLIQWMRDVEAPLLDYLVRPSRTAIPLVNADFETLPFGESLDVVTGWEPPPGMTADAGKSNATSGVDGGGCGVLRLDGGMRQLSTHDILPGARYFLTYQARYVYEENDVRAVLYYDRDGTPEILASHLIDLTSSYTAYTLEFQSLVGQDYVGRRLGVEFLHIGTAERVVRLDNVTLEYEVADPSALSPTACQPHWRKLR